MKYCLKCGEIVSDNSTSKDDTVCSECGTPYTEDNMTGEMFESLNDIQKQEYADSLFLKIKSSEIFDEHLFNNNIDNYGEASLYSSWWYDKAKQLGARFCHRYETEEELQARIDRTYGKDSIAYQKAIVQQCIDNAQAQKQENNNVPKCPTCGSPDVEKISLTSKAVGGALFGLFSSNVRKTMHCKNCGYKW